MGGSPTWEILVKMKKNENKIMWLENLQGAEISYRLVQK